ncbi:MAG: biotin transporter BioY [Lachnospiraceae bacterium]
MNQTTAYRAALSTKDIILVGMFAACMIVISQISIPMPTGVPLTIQLFGIALIGSALGWKRGVYAICTYILLGAVGLPVFSNFSGGFSKLVSFTGGYIWAWPFMVILCGVPVSVANPKLRLFVSTLLALTGLALVEIIGAAQWSFLAGDKSFPMIMVYALTAFIPKDIILTLLGMWVGKEIRKRIL